MMKSTRRPLRGRSSQAQTRTLLTLAAVQLAGGLGLTAAVAVGGLIADDLSGPAVSGLPLGTAVAGTAAAALLLGSITHRRGRRYGLRWGWQIGAAGAVLAVVATTLRSLPGVILAMLLFGAAEAASGAARYAATDLAARKGSAMGAILAMTAVATTAGPLLAGPAARQATALNMPPLAGPFLLSAVVFGVAAVIVAGGLRPDPLLLARQGGRTVVVPPSLRGGLSAVLRSSATGVLAMSGGNFVMIGLMSVTPVHLAHADAALGPHMPRVGVLLGLHLASMYAPSLLTGRIADRTGTGFTIALGASAFAVCGTAVMSGLVHRPPVLAATLVLLGVGWNLTLMGGSLAVTHATVDYQLAKVQASADAIMAVAGAVGSLAAGIVLALEGYRAVGLLALTAAAVLIALTAASALRRPARSRSTGAPTGAAAGPRPGRRDRSAPGSLPAAG